MATIAIGIGKSPSGQYTCEVPVDALSESGVPPEQGDKVSYSVEGTVQSISGPTATVSIDSVNGEPVGEEASETPEEEQGEEGQQGAPGGAGGGQTPVAASGPGAMGGGLGGGAPGISSNLLRPRMTRRAPALGTLPGETLAGMGARLRKGAKGRPMPF
jgi:hypothetical protein